MKKVFKYSVYNLLRSSWLLIYFLFFVAVTFAFLSFSESYSKAIVSLLTVSMAVIPLVSILFGVMYYYSSREFVELLICQPLKRKSVFSGQLLGLTISLSVCFLAGVGLPFLFYGIIVSGYTANFLLLLLAGTGLTCIFSALAFWVAVKNENRIKGFGYAILLWLYFVLLYDGIFLFLLIYFQDYPLEPLTLALTLLNPVDVSRVMVLLDLDISALMGYTGAVFKQFFYSGTGVVAAFSAIFVWILLPWLLMLRKIKKKDF